MRRKHRRILVTPERLWHSPLRALLVSFLVLVCGVSAGFWYSDRDQSVLNSKLESVQEELKLADATIIELRREVADARLQESVASGALKSLQEDLSSHRMQIDALRQEVAHYRDLLSPAESGEGVRIEAFRVIQTRSLDSFRFEMRLEKGQMDGGQVSGHLQIEVEADAAGHRVQFPLDELDNRAEYPIKYRFRHFQQVSGTMNFPPGNRPLRVTVRLRPEDRDAKPVIRSFSWIVEAG